MDLDDAYDDFMSSPIQTTPAKLRRQIMKLLASTDVKIGEFQKILGVNANSYGMFMHGKYKDPWSAVQNGTFSAAAWFFEKERLLGKHALGKPRSRKAAAASPTLGTAAATKTKSVTGAGAKPKLPDVSSTPLEDDHTWLLPGEVRKALQDLQLSHDTSVAGLAWAAGVPYQSFNNFVKAGGSHGGKDNQAYRPAAALVEKVRIALGKPKSAKRKALEAEVAAGRVDLRTGGGPRLGADPDGKFYCLPGSHLAKDALGRYYIAHP